MDINILLRLIYILLGLTFIIVGIYLIIVLREVHQSLQRTRSIIVRTDNILDLVENKIVRPAAGLASYLGLAKEFVGLVGSFRSAFSKSRERKKG